MEVSSTNSGRQGQPDSCDPLVSIIVTTRNSAQYLRRCLASIKRQTYKRIEIIVVDNFSTDSTKAIAVAYADLVVQGGPERSAQMNRGAALARGSYLFRVDADFELERTVVEECVSLCRAGADAVVVHNTADASVGLLARIRKFEVDMYKYSLNHTAARFMDRELFRRVGGLRADVTAGEDYDLQNRLRSSGANIVWAKAEAVHLGEPVRLAPLLRKYFFYGVDFVHYRRYNRSESHTQLAFVRRDYISNWRSFVRHPVLGGLFVGYHIAKFAAGGLGYAAGSLLESRIVRSRLRRSGDTSWKENAS